MGIAGLDEQAAALALAVERNPEATLVARFRRSWTLACTTELAKPRWRVTTCVNQHPNVRLINRRINPCARRPEAFPRPRRGETEPTSRKKEKTKTALREDLVCVWADELRVSLHAPWAKSAARTGS